MRTATDVQVSYRTEAGWVDALSGMLTPVQFPTATSVGVDAIPGWTPTFTITDDNYQVFDAGAVVEDIRVVNGTIYARAPHVTIRRCEVINGSITNEYGNVHNGMVVEDCTIRASPAGAAIPLNSAMGIAGYTVRRTAIIDTNEGPHTGFSDAVLDDPTDPLGYAVRIFDCYFQITGPMPCDGIDYHGDILQCFDGGNGGVPLQIRNSTFISNDNLPDCGASAGIGSGVGQSGLHDIDGLILAGAAASYHNDCGGTVRNMYFVDNSWIYFPVSIDTPYWPLITEWSAWTVVLDENGQPTTRTHSVPHGYPGYGPFDPP